MDKSSIDLLTLAQTRIVIKKVSNHNGGEYAGPCPLCGGKDRFRVWPTPRDNDGGRFWCRQCQIGGDAIQFVMLTENVQFIEACQRLGLKVDERPRQYTHRTAERPRQAPSSLGGSDWTALNDPVWQECATNFIWECADNLLEPKYKRIFEYVQSRGVTVANAKVHMLGYNPNSRNTKWGDTPVWLPAGVVIPWGYMGQWWRVNIRSLDPNAERRYIQPTGCANGLYNAYGIRPGCTAVMVEGEFDCQAIMGTMPQVVPVATGSTSGSRLYQWLALLGLASQHIIAFDDDQAGEAAAEYWLNVLPGAIRLTPTKHDVSEMYQAGESIPAWIRSVL